MNGLSLCAGIGGLDLGLGLAVKDYRTVGYVEREAGAAAVIVARMAESALCLAPVWDDLRSFPGHAYRDRVDICLAGFPCQPWSVAGRRQGQKDARWLWPDIFRIIQAVDPPLVFLENVTGLLRGGLSVVLEDLASSGFDAEWDTVSAGQVGASHERKRVFILAYDPLLRHNWRWNERQWGRELTDDGFEMADTDGPVGRGAHAGWIAEQRAAFEGAGGEYGAVVDANKQRLQGWGDRCELQGKNESPTWPPGPEDLNAWRDILARDPTLKPALCRVADGIPQELVEPAMQCRTDRIRALGNAVVPVVAATAFTVLSRRIHESD